MKNLERIERLEAVRAVAEPNRLAITRLLLARPHTISSLGKILDKHPAWVRHHVKALETAGLVNLAETRTIRNYTEKVYAATAAAFAITMLVRPDTGGSSSLVALVSHDLAVELLASEAEKTTKLAAAVTGSLDGLVGLRQGMADIAGCHLLDVDSGQYNLPYVRHIFADRDIVVVTLAHREQGLIVRAGNPLGVRTLDAVADSSIRFVNRNRGSGTRLWIDRMLSGAGIDVSQVSGYETTVDTHTEAARRVAEGHADLAVGIAAAAKSFGLQFMPLFKERYDLVMSEEVYETEEVARLIERLHTKEFRQQISRIRGYDSESTGDEYRIAV
jgi:putative molybdopterin biosynthesis protein